MKTIWDIIKSEINRLKGHTDSNYKNSPDTFHDHFLSTAEKIMRGIRYSDTKAQVEIKIQCTPNKLCSLNPQANYADQATAACWRS
jgi:hypothetical protein